MIQARKSIVLYAAFTVASFLQSCDPTYSIAIKNSTQDTLKVLARTTVDFYSVDANEIALGEPYGQEWVKFEVLPNESVNCGMAIAGIEDELPFTELKFYWEQDSIIAATPEGVLELFETNSQGRLRTPYEINIK